MQHTNEVEREMEATMSTGTTYWDCFRGVNCRRSEIVMIGWLVQGEFPHFSDLLSVPRKE